jgi:hypothetical protein
MEASAARGNRETIDTSVLCQHDLWFASIRDMFQVRCYRTYRNADSTETEAFHVETVSDRFSTISGQEVARSLLA